MRGDDLMARHFNDLEWTIPQLIPEGLTLLVGAPKAGKSWLILQCVLAVADGGRLFGDEHVQRRPVLHLALEDSPRRLKGRVTHLQNGHAPDLAGWHHYTSLPEGWAIPDLVDEWARNVQVDAAPLVVIDTLGKVRGTKRPNEGSYEYDYRVAGAIKKLADSHPGMSVVAVHHDRKANSSDFVEDVSGTNGLAGAADTLLVVKRDRNDSNAVLLVTGRDVDEAAYAATFDAGRWSIEGDDYRQARAAAAVRLATVGKGDTAATVVDFIAEHVAVRPKDIIDGLDLSDSTVYQTLSRLHRDGRVDRNQGRYFLPATEPTP